MRRINAKICAHLVFTELGYQFHVTQQMHKKVTFVHAACALFTVNAPVCLMPAYS